MIVRLQFEIDPQPKQRARVRIMDSRRPEWATSPPRRATVWTPERTASFEQAVNLTAQSQLAGLRIPRPMVPSPGRVAVATTFWLRRPKTGRGSVLEVPTLTPDLDNLVKALWDGLKRVLWDDDGQVVHAQDTKLWAPPGTRPQITMVVADSEGMEELVRSAGESVIERFSTPPGPGAASSAATP